MDTPRIEVATEAKLDLHEGTFTSPGGERLHIVTASESALMAVAMRLDRLATTPESLPTSRSIAEQTQEIMGEVLAKMDQLLKGQDAFDVLSLVRQYLMPPNMASWSESDRTTAPWAAAEVILLVLLGNGLPQSLERPEHSPASIVPKLIELAEVLVSLATFNARETTIHPKEPGSQTDGLYAMSLRLNGHETTVRGRQHDAIATQINESLLQSPQAEKAMTTHLGFTYRDIIKTRSALIDEVSDLHREVFELLSTVRMETEPTLKVRDALESAFSRPGRLNTVTSEAVHLRCPEVSLDAVERVLEHFSIRPDGRSALDLAGSFINSCNPISGKGLVQRQDNSFLVLPGAIALDEIRRLCEPAIKGTSAWNSYGKARDSAVEDLVGRTLRRLIPVHGDHYLNLTYRNSLEGHDLSSTSTSHAAAPLTESDLLLVVDGVAFAVEVKAGGFRQRARQGGTMHLEGDLQKTVREAARQAARLRDLITGNSGVWRADGSWLGLSSVREVHTMVVCLEDLGPLALSTAEMVRSGILPQADLPWVVSLADLLVIADVIQRPEHFLTYLRRRTSGSAALWVTGSDELDLFMWFVSGGFYFVPDPDQMHAARPGSPPPTSKMRSEYASQGRTLVGTLTDPLDAYYYWKSGLSSEPAQLPARCAMPLEITRIVDAMRLSGSSGWLRAASDLDGYSRLAQDKIAASIREIERQTRNDLRFHSVASGGVDESGSWIFIFATSPSTPENLQSLEEYLVVKKHQMQADRALGVLLSASGRPEVSIWLSHPPTADPELDKLVKIMRLVPADRAPRVVPPHVRKPRRRKAAKKRRKRKQ